MELEARITKLEADLVAARATATADIATVKAGLNLAHDRIDGLKASIANEVVYADNARKQIEANIAAMQTRAVGIIGWIKRRF